MFKVAIVGDVHRALETMTLDKRVLITKRELEVRFAELTYERESAMIFIVPSQGRTFDVFASTAPQNAARTSKPAKSTVLLLFIRFPSPSISDCFSSRSCRRYSRKHTSHP